MYLTVTVGFNGAFSLIAAGVRLRWPNDFPVEVCLGDFNAGAGDLINFLMKLKARQRCCWLKQQWQWQESYCVSGLRLIF